ncbi:MAG: hypothetical protein JWN08_105 [Frankiales bacterium]|nr:hypothetical protein [Frankiales bacterium]
MTARRRLLVTASAMVSLAALTACEKPAPIVTVVNEGRSVYAEAGVWCFEDQTGDECAQRNEDVPTLEVLPGTLGIDVDKELADSRWIVTIVDPANPEQQQVSSGVQEDKHYYAFDLPDLGPDAELLLTVRALAEDDGQGGEPKARGSWQFQLVSR